MDFIENKTRQNNICIYNIAEQSEGGDMKGFIDRLCEEALKLDKVPQIARAHRIGVLKKGARFSRPIMINLVNYDGKREILKAAWSKKEVLYQDARVYFDHDFTTKVKQQRTAFRDLREQLRKHQIKSHILAPSRLKVFNQDGSVTIYRNAEEAKADLEQKGTFETDAEAD